MGRTKLARYHKISIDILTRISCLHASEAHPGTWVVETWRWKLLTIWKLLHKARAKQRRAQRDLVKCHKSIQINIYIYIISQFPGSRTPFRNSGSSWEVQVWRKAAFNFQWSRIQDQGSCRFSSVQSASSTRLECKWSQAFAWGSMEPCNAVRVWEHKDGTCGDLWRPVGQKAYCNSIQADGV